MRSNYDLYGFPMSALNNVADILERILSIKWVIHESFYIGEYYRFGLPGKEEIILQRNFNEDEKEWSQPEFKDYPLLLYVNKTHRSGEIRTMLLSALKEKVVQLRRELL